MHPNFEKAFETSKKRDYLNARALYEDLYLDIKTYSDYFLIKEILFLLDIQILSQERKNNHDELLNMIQELNCEILTGEGILQQKNKQDKAEYDYMILISKKSLFRSASYVGINEKEGFLSFYYFKDKYRIISEYVSLDNIDIIEYDSKIYFYQLGCSFTLICEQKVNTNLKNYFKLFKALFVDHYLKHYTGLIDYDQVHEWFEMLDSKVHIDLTRIETQDFNGFTFDEKNQKEIFRYLKMIDPVMWISDNNLERVQVHDLQFDLIGNRWCNHRIFLELLAVLKTLPDLEFGTSVFIHKNSFYLPYEQSYYICRNITRLESDQEFK